MKREKKNILIVGLGNPLVGDDGVGIYIIRHLQRLSLPTGVKVIDCGTDVLKILSHIEGQERIILIDAVDGKQPPGTVYRFSKDNLLNFNGVSKSAHLISVTDSLRLLEKLNPDFQKAEVEMIGIQPARVEIGNRLSPSVEEAAQKVIRELADKYLLPEG